MTRIKSVEEAVQMIEVCAIKEGEATENGDYKTNNKYARHEANCIEYLYKHGQLQALCSYLKHDNHSVRLSAAYALLPLYEEDCKKVLYELAKDWSKKSSPKKEEQTSADIDNKVEQEKSEYFSLDILRLSQIFECPLTGDNDLRNEQSGFYVLFDPVKQKIEIRVNTFVNPYTQEVETVYQERLDRFKVFEQVATIEANEPSKLGFMQIVLTIPTEKATNDVLTQLKNTIYSIYNEWRQNESLVWFKAEYHKGVSYFEGSWWMPCRAIIKNQCGYERYDFSDEMKFDEEMWDIVQGEYDEFENSDSFVLIDGKDFQEMWETTELNYKPKPF